MENNRLSALASPLKTLAVCLIITLLIGYAVALVQVFDRSHFDMERTVKYYRGDDMGEESLMLPQTFATMLSVAHVHTFSQPFIFASVGFIFAFSSLSNRKKSTFIALGFIGIFLSNLAPWLIRYALSQAVYLYPLSQTMIAVSLLTMSFVSLRELWKK